MDERNRQYEELDMGYEDFFNEKDSQDYFYALKYTGKNWEKLSSYNDLTKKDSPYTSSYTTPSSDEIHGKYDVTVKKQMKQLDSKVLIVME